MDFRGKPIKKMVEYILMKEPIFLEDVTWCNPDDAKQANIYLEFLEKIEDRLDV